MAIYWPSPTSSCRVDLLTASYSQVYNAARCQSPLTNSAVLTELAQEVYSNALAIRGAISLANQAAPAIQTVANAASNALANTLPGVVNSVTTILNQVTAAVRDVNARTLQDSQRTSTDLIGQVTGAIGGLLGNASSTVGGVINQATTSVGGLVGQAGSALSGVIGNVSAGVRDVLGDAGDTIRGLVTQVTGSVGDILGDAGAVLGSLIGQVQRGVGDFLDDAGGAIGGLIGNVRGFIGDLIANVQTGIGGIVERLTSIPGALLELAGGVGDAIGGLGTSIAGGIGDFLLGPMSEVLTAFSKDKEVAMADVVAATVDRVLSNPETPPEYRDMLHSFKEPSHPIWMVVLAFVLPIVGAQLLGTLSGPVLQPALQEELKATRPTLLGLGDAVSSHFRGDLTRSALGEVGARWGYPDADVERAVELGRPRPGPGDLATWLHRELVNEGEIVRRLEAQGWAAEDIPRIVESMPVLPTVSDAVRFAVREAFPGQAAFGGPRGQGVPQAFVELAALQGLDPEYARSYWAAHWELPSVTAAFSMFHRGLIDEAKLRGLLKEQDLAPEWVDNMIAVAFDPLTRVDVRRMRELGVLSPADVEAAYRDLGYSPTNARRLRDFVEADLAATAAAATANERDLTRADLVGAYADGILTRLTAQEALEAIGYDRDEAGLILDREDIRVARAIRKETRTAIVDQVLAGVIDSITAQDKLAAAEYTTDEIAATLAEIERKRAATVRQPTKAELDRFRKAGLIDEVDYRDELARLGYAPRWVDAFVALGAEVETNDA